MRREGEIIELADWLSTPAGRYLLDWEQQQIDACVADVFGFHALQVGLPQLDALRANRMPHRWVSTDVAWPDVQPSPAEGASASSPSLLPLALHCDFDALPFPAASLDLVVLPHALELARDPHRALAEVERVLVPEGRVVIAGLNPTSLWGLRQTCGRLCRRLPGGGKDLFLPRVGEFIGYRRLRDWLRLLSFEVEGGRFGCYRPPVRTQRWLERFAWMESTGQLWWPVFGAAYVLVAVKRVRGMRLIGLARRDRNKPQPAPAVVANRQRETESA
ncbi:MAG: class I SAM-dependent methyltransferase [Burkholderiales bacterium]|nr:MAG: class I SAM-dependent methyltransferase [Burkholderiales bacterium]